MQRESERIRETGSALDRISQVADHSATAGRGDLALDQRPGARAQDLVRAMQRISEVTQPDAGANHAVAQLAPSRSSSRASPGSGLRPPGLAPSRSPAVSHLTPVLSHGLDAVA